MRPDNRYRPNPQTAQPPRPQRQVQRNADHDTLRFMVTALVLVGMIALVWWLGWRSPWARHPLNVHVEVMPH